MPTQRIHQFVMMFVLLQIMAGCASRRLPVGSPFAFGVVNEIESARLGEKRILNVYLPPSYEETLLKRYPVIYLLDGAAHEDYHHVTGLVQFLVMYELMPESIVVGIANIDRYRDFTSPSDVSKDLSRIPTSGGSPRFRAFIEEELQPYIDATYRTNSKKMLIGQSLGGLLATEILVENKDLFDAYIIISPSLWWNDQRLLKRLPSFLKQHPRLRKQVFVSAGTEAPEMNDLIDKMVLAFKEHAPKSTRFQFVLLADETHATVLHRSLYRAFEFLYGETHPGL